MVLGALASICGRGIIQAAKVGAKKGAKEGAEAGAKKIGQESVEKFLKAFGGKATEKIGKQVIDKIQDFGVDNLKKLLKNAATGKLDDAGKKALGSLFDNIKGIDGIGKEIAKIGANGMGKLITETLLGGIPGASKAGDIVGKILKSGVSSAFGAGTPGL